MRDIKGYEGLYAVTSCGKVWSYRRKKFLKPRLDKGGYLMVNLYNDCGQKTYKVHRLVADAYIPNLENKPQINHKDEIKTHNYIGNLEWATSKENNNYGTRNQKCREARNKPVYCVELDKVFDSALSASVSLNIDNSLIGRVCKGKGKTAGGYHWRYYNG